MDLLWTVLLVFLVCAEAKNVTEVQARLGQNVTLSCTLDAQDIYWYIEINSQVRGRIAQSFSNGSDGQSYVFPLKKYVVIEKNSLVITNITSEDYRLYFCARRLDDKLVFEETFSIVSNVSTTPPTTTTSVTMTQPQQPIREIWQSEPVVYSSFALNVVLFLVVTGLVFIFLSLKKKNCNYQVNDPSPFTCGNSETLESPQYEEIQFSTSRPSTPSALHIECIYSKAQPPRSTLSRHLGHLDAYQTPGQ